MTIKEKTQKFLDNHVNEVWAVIAIATGVGGFALGDWYAGRCISNGLEKACLVHPEIKDLMLDAFSVIKENGKIE